MRHDADCERSHGSVVAYTCFCAVRSDIHRFQAESWERVTVATESEKDEVLRWLNDHDPDVLREAMNETGVGA